jgi:hypothetical protein
MVRSGSQLALLVLSGSIWSLGACSGKPGDQDEPTPKGPGQLRVGGDFHNVCPIIESYLLIPQDIEPGETAEIKVRASDPDDRETALQFAWQATSGTFSNPALAETTYACAAPGTQFLTLRIRDARDCVRELGLEVTCLEP